MKTAAFLLACALASLTYDFRAFLPYPAGNVARAEWLKGWGSRGGYGLNCAGLIANTHGGTYLQPEEFYNGVSGQIQIVAEFGDRNQIDESKLLPGDIAAWHGVHVAMFVKPGIWIDGDSRRGYVDSYSLQTKPASDPWFAGKVRIVRWTSNASMNFSSSLGRSGGCDLSQQKVCQ
jgi:hypothetical protein